MGKEIKSQKPATVDYSEDKKRLHQICLHAVTMRLQRLKATKEELQASANEETKSSAGDKYETGRSMAQLEIDKLAGQIKDAEQQLSILQSIKDNGRDKVQLGSLILTTQGVFYLAVSLGPVEVDQEKFMVISTFSPIGKAMNGKRKGDSFENFNKKILIKEIY
ncbi:MAG: GreA/GreB family elongation factor [Cytophagaceae bacterium]|jgi:transcription elongation GreA/GreB family factor|nr:GreA/GreB family elongation factor [Cytophagaceae bacterium]